MTDAYVALLRGINVGGNHMVPMKALSRLFVAAGCTEVRTYIQSGNVLFHASPELAAALPALIMEQIEKSFGFAPAVLLRSRQQLRDVIRKNPYVQGTERLYVLFLAHAPAAGDVARLDPDRSPPDGFTVLGQEVYLHLPMGGARSKLTSTYFDKTLATVSTARNWRTVTTLLTMLGD